MTFDWAHAARTAAKPTPAKWVRVSVGCPCPICGRPDWCSIDEMDGTVICMRVPEGSERSVDLGHGVGYVHKKHAIATATASRSPRPTVRRYVEESSQAFTLDYEAILRRWNDQTTNAAMLAFAEQLGVLFASLERLGAAWCESRKAWAFPMCDSIRRVVGIRFRTEDGSKFALHGSHAGLFVPTGLNTRPRLFICEGPTDTAAALSIGLDAIGRPSCSGGTEYICDLLQMGRRREVMIIADADGPGRFGANQLADRLVGICQSVKVIDTAPHKDLRQWVCRRGSEQVLDGLINKSGLSEKGSG